MAVHNFSSISWLTFRELAARPLIAILPLGALEAHGPHLPLGTDILIAEAMARSGAERLSTRGFEVAVLPSVPFAPAPFAAEFPGTIDIAPEATTALVSGVARSLARAGARATVIANAHHDPSHVAAIRAGVEEAERERPGQLIFPDLTRRRWASRLTEEFKSGACHAGRYESSIVLAEAPVRVAVERMKLLAANMTSLVTAIQRGERTFSEAGGDEAYFGAPAEATAAEGREIIEQLGRIIEDAVVEVLGTDAHCQPS